MRWWIGSLAVAGLMLAPAGPVSSAEPPSASSDALASWVAKPRYYVISAQGGMANMDGGKVCFGGEPFRRMIAAVEDTSRAPGVAEQMDKGCASKRERGADGKSFRLERSCREADGAPFTSRLVLSGTVEEIRQHFEVEMKLGSAAPQTSVADVTMTYSGDCPDHVKPGQMLTRDGTIVSNLLGG